MSKTHSYATLRVTEDMLRAIFPNEKIQETYSEFRIKANGSIVVNKETSKYFDFASGEGGNIVTLCAREMNISNGEAYKILSGVTNITPVKPSPKIIKKDFSNYAYTLYQEAVPIKDTLAERYLLSRCILPMFLHNKQIDPELRYLEQRNKDGVLEKMLLAPITDKDGRLKAIHRIYLNDDATKIIKKSLGGVKGYGVWLTNRNLLSKKLYIVEGIEDGLSVIQENYGISCVAITGAIFLPSFEIPEGIREVVLILDNDLASTREAQNFGIKHKDSNFSIKVWRPDFAFKDFNEQLQSNRNSLMGVAYDH